MGDGQIDNWEVFRSYADFGSAEVIAARLMYEDVPAMIQQAGHLGAPDVEFRIWVPSFLAHRARWILLQAAPTDAELTFLATGKLPG